MNDVPDDKGLTQAGQPRKTISLDDNPRLLARIRHQYEVKGLGYTKIGKLLSVPRSSIRDAIHRRGWKRGGTHGAPNGQGNVADTSGELPENARERPGSAAAAPPPSAPPPTGSKKRPQGKKGRAKGATIVQFPGGADITPPEEPPPKPVRVLPRALADSDRDVIKSRLHELRAAMSIDQLARLARAEGTLAKYGHLIDVWLDPQRYTDTTGLEGKDVEDKIVATQTLALRMLLPGERDTLAGAIGVWTKALQTMLELERKVAGIGMVVRPGSQIPGLTLDGTGTPAEGGGAPIVGLGLAALPTEELRRVTTAMELLQRRQQQRQDAPRPPSPDPIDDIFDHTPDPDFMATLEPELEPER